MSITLHIRFSIILQESQHIWAFPYTLYRPEPRDTETIVDFTSTSGEATVGIKVFFKCIFFQLNNFWTDWGQREWKPNSKPDDNSRAFLLCRQQELRCSRIGRSGIMDTRAKTQFLVFVVPAIVCSLCSPCPICSWQRVRCQCEEELVTLMRLHFANKCDRECSPVANLGQLLVHAGRIIWATLWGKGLRARDTVLLNIPLPLCQLRENAIDSFSNFCVLIHFTSLWLLRVKAVECSVYLAQCLNDGLAPAGPS